MKFKTFLLPLVLIACMKGAEAQISQNMSLLYHWTDTTFPNGWTGGAFNDCWGYVDSAGREYAIIGSTLGHHIFDITSPTNAILVDFETGRESSSAAVHRDYKTYQNYLYAVCDEGNSSLQIYDLQYLPDSIHLVYDKNALCITSHNIFICNDVLYVCGVRDTNNQNPVPLRALSLSNPANPTFLSDLTSSSFNYVHDVMVRNDTAFLSCANDGLFIYDYTTPTNPTLINSITSYPEQGYNHSAWVSDDGKYLCFADETHGKGLKLFDISDILNPTLKSIFRSNLLNDPNQGSIAHNPFFVGNQRIVISYYHDGVQVFDIQNPNSPTQFGWYDTFLTDTSYSGYGPGCWGVYPYLPSKVVIASDIKNGLFLLDGTGVLATEEINSGNNLLPIYPNPADQFIYCMLSEAGNNKGTIRINDELGRTILMINDFDLSKPVNIKSLSNGLYYIEVILQNKRWTNKLLISR